MLYLGFLQLGFEKYFQGYYVLAGFLTGQVHISELTLEIKSLNEFLETSHQIKI